MGEILVGTCSWTDPSLRQSGWYPAIVQNAAGRLRYYASQFPLVEVEATFHSLPIAQVVQRWIDRTPADFVFNIRAFAPLSQHSLDPRSLPGDLQAALPPALRTRRRLSYRDLPPPLVRELWRRFQGALLPLHQSGKLGAVLLQFPPGFHISRANRAAIARVRGWLPDYRVAIEFRHVSWLQERSRQQTLDHLADHGITYVCVDAPQGSRSSIPPLAVTTNPDLAMLRLHGRNRQIWDAPGLSPAEQSNYRYRPEELSEWVPKVQQLADEAAQTHVLFNNCYADNGVQNAAELGHILGDRIRRQPLPSQEPVPETA